MKRRGNDIKNYFIGVIIILLVNFIAQSYFVRLDLTEEKRFSINPATKTLLENLDDQVYVEVYLEGDFPAGFERLQSTIKETLDEFRIYAGDNVQYNFVDPNDFPDTKSTNEFHQQLAEKGLQPTNLFAKEGDKKVEKIIFPGAIIRKGDREITVLLLKGASGVSPEEQLNQSVEGVEYNIADAIRKLDAKERKKIAFIGGHNELGPLDVYSMKRTLESYYDVTRVNLPTEVFLEGYDLIIVASPDTAFGDPEKYKIDQHIMRGGKAIFLIDQMRTELDSIKEDGALALPRNLNLDEMFFKYGVRINNDLIQDYYCGFLPMMVGYVGNQPQTKMMPWRFYSIVNTFGDHPISKNLNAVYAKFVSTIDTVKAKGIKKTPLLFTSKNSKILPSPVRLNFNDARIDVDPNMFTNGPLPIGYLLEGKFESMFKNQLTEKTEKKFKFQEQGVESKIIVFSDGDLIRNDFNPKNKAPYPLGYDRWLGNQFQFANQELLLNSVDYLLDESGLIEARAKDIKLRPLDKAKIKDDALFWQIINIGVPLVLIILFGIVWMIIRKRKFENNV